MQRIVILFACSLLGGAALAVPAAKDPAAKGGAVFFENRIRPILIERCYGCHSEEAGKQKGGLLLDRPSGWLKGGDSGPAIVPHNLGKSLVARAIQRKDEDTAMPPKEEEALSEEEVTLLLRWIRMGAPGPKRSQGETEFSRLGDQSWLGEQAKTHWSFQPVVKPALPVSPEKHPVDAFIRAKLVAKKMEPAPPAHPRSQLRRLHYDLTGLPPDYETLQEKASWTEVVDRLLDAPQFGERWGRYWLDIARYADTREWQAAGADSRYPFAWTYRDYVIRAFNEDKPYDQFIREQIAADAWATSGDDPNLAAMGFLTVGSRYRNNRAEIYNDRIDVVTRGIMGLTVSCARCHDHKYDPIPTTDYYALYGVFASSKDIADYPVIREEKAPDPEQVKAYETARAAKEKALADYTAKLAREAQQDFRAKPAAYLVALHDIVLSKKKNVRGLIAGGKLKETALTPLSQSLPRIGRERAFKADPVLRPWAELINKPDPQFAGALKAFLAKETKTHPLVLEALQREPAIANRRAFLQRYGEVFAAALQSKDASDAALRELLNDPKGPFHITPRQAEVASRLLGKGRRILSDLYNAITDIDAEHPGAPARAMVLEDLPKPFQPAVFERGDAQRRGEKVDRRFLSVLGGEAKPFQGGGRRELAEAITDPQNPFTARVHVNRVWMHLFGEPLVESVGDFGLQAEEPLQRELLDWLAATFMEEGWSTKKLIRRLVTSKTYRQASLVREAYVKRDPDNRLWWRANLRRLDFEAMRDSMLAASDRLDLQLGGRSVDITAPPYPNRRTVYAYVDRVNLDDMFTTFDFPSPDVSSPERPETLVPQQALFSMNDPFTIEQARALANHPDFRKDWEDKSGTEKVRFFYRRLFQRDPTQAEVLAGMAFLRSAIETIDEVEGGAWQYGYGRPDGSTFTRLRFFDRKRKAYQVSKLFPHPKLGHVLCGATGGHPGRDEAHSVIRRWTVPYDGEFAINGMLRHASNKGDGVTARVFSSRHGEHGAWTALDGEAQTAVKRLVLNEGDLVTFSVSPNEGALSDGHRWTLNIRRLGPAEEAPPGIRTVWVSQADFAPPPPPPLRPWDQLAQALMMTNEFMFID